MTSLGLCTAILVIVAGAAGAQDSQSHLSELQKPIYGPDGYYVGVSGVYALEIGGVPRSDDVGGSPGANLRIGFRFNRWLATEIHGEWLHDFAYDDTQLLILGQPVSLDGGGFTAWDVTLCGRFYPIRGRFQPFAVVGAGVLQKIDHGTGDEDTGTGFAGRFGVGLDIYINPTVSVSVDAAYVVPLTHIQDYDFVAIGLGIQFW